MMPLVKNLTIKGSNKKIVFDDDGEVVFEGSIKAKKTNSKKSRGSTQEDVQKPEHETNNNTERVEQEEDYFAKRDKLRLERKHKAMDHDDVETKWYNVFKQFPSSNEVVELKDTEKMQLFNLCQSSFEAELPAFQKRNSSDSRWLQTALHKGTAKDRANAGALLVTSNPLGNLEALNTLISYTKLSNKSSSEVIGIMTDLWKEVLLPPQRKLISLDLRGADWRLLRKDIILTEDRQRRIYAYWYFENQLKDYYFEFLKNVQQCIQTGQENNKNASIVAASQLLAYAPEKEQMLLTMLVNKLGDPVAKIASKALHHLTEVTHRHPNMCGVIVVEAEKLLFRNNISERAQHFALCFLASIAPSGRPEVCSKLVHICFGLFKVLVQKGAVNNRTMQAILRCLQKAILEAQPAKGETELLNKEMQDTIYRLVHLADIRISVQTLGLLLQLVTVKTEKSDRFYNALYKKLLDMDITTVGTKTAAQLLHIVHRAIHIDANVPRAKAFIKRLLQVSLYMPPAITAGCLIVIQKLLHSRKDLMDGKPTAETDTLNGAPVAEFQTVLPKVYADDEELAKFDSDGEEKYEDVRDNEAVGETTTNETQLEPDNSVENENEVGEMNTATATGSSWYHAKIVSKDAEVKVRDMAASKYDPFHRVPSFSGAEFSLRNELLLLHMHYHPTVQVFAENILNEKRIAYYGDPLRDFSLAHFLERFAFKNPKKLDKPKTETPTVVHKQYKSFGARGKPVKSLTKQNCTEDEMYILNFLEEKRQRQLVVKKPKKSDEDDEEDIKADEVDDDEFEEYLDGFFGKKAKAASASDAADEELDYLTELGGELKAADKKKPSKSKKADDDDDVADIDADWGDDDALMAKDDDDDNGSVSDDENGSIEFDEDDDDDGGSISLDDAADDDVDADSMSEPDSIDDESGNEDDDEELSPSKAKRPRKHSMALNAKSFAKKLKHSDDMSSLFAAADDFAELLEETGKTKGQGTVNAVLNKDKSSDKQMKWEEKRRSNSKTYTKKIGKGKIGSGVLNKRKY